MGIGKSSPTAHWVVIDDNTVRVIFLLFAHFFSPKAQSIPDSDC